MANVILGPGGDWNLLGDEDWFYQYTEFSDPQWTSTSVTYTDGDGDRVVLSGSDLAESGVVTEVLIEDSEGRTIMEFTGLSVSATTVGNALENETAANFAIVENFLPLLLAGDDLIVGTHFTEELIGALNGGNDTILGFGGDDFFRGSGTGDDILDGGKGIDTLAYHSDWLPPAQTRGVRLDAVEGVAITPWGGTDKIKNFEIFRGSQQDDVYFGSDKRREVFELLGGNDKVDGRGGIDIADYSSDDNYGGAAGITVNVAQGIVIDGYGSTDHLTGIEGIVGTDADDTFNGSKRSDNYKALGGDDTITGGKGADFYLFSAGVQHHTIVDFATSGKRHDTIAFLDFEELGSFADLQSRMTQVDDDVVIDLGTDAAITLFGIELTDLKGVHFDF